MSRFLFTTLGLPGHVLPTLEVARQLIQRGHWVGFILWPRYQAFESLQTTMRALGVELFESPVRPIEGDSDALNRTFSQRGPTPAKSDADVRYAKILLEVPARIEWLREKIRAVDADVVCSDGMSLTAPVAAQLEGRPFALTATSLSFLAPGSLASAQRLQRRAEAPLKAEFAARYGLELPLSASEEILSPQMNIFFTTRAVVGEDVVLPPATHLVGAVRRPPAAEPGAPLLDRLNGGRRVLFVSFGSILRNARLLKTIVAAAADLDVQLVLSGVTSEERQALGPVPESAVLAELLPQLAVLDQAACFVTHGGANSVMEAFDRGVPMLVLPLSNDQPVQAYFVERSGAGLSLRPEELTVESCRRALSLLLGDGRYRERARSIQQSFRSQDGGRVAAELLEQLSG